MMQILNMRKYLSICFFLALMVSVFAANKFDDVTITDTLRVQGPATFNGIVTNNSSTVVSNIFVRGLLNGIPVSSITTNGGSYSFGSVTNADLTVNGPTVLNGTVLIVGVATNSAFSFLLGNYNEIGNGLIATNRINGSVLLMNTNGMASGLYGNLVPPDNARTLFNLNVGNGATAVGYSWGDLNNANGLGQRYGFVFYSQTGNNVQLHSVGNNTSLNIGSANVDQMVFNGGTNITSGATSTDTRTINSVFTAIPNGQNIGGYWFWPSSINGTVSNLGTSYIGGNLNVVSNINASTYTSTPVNLLASETTSATNEVKTVNGGAGTYYQDWSHELVTATAPTVNSIQTNGPNQILIMAEVGFAASSYGGIWATDAIGGGTNFFRAGNNTASTNVFRLLVDPNQKFMFSNSVGTSTILQWRVYQ